MNLVLVFMCLHTIKALFLSSEATFTCSIIHKGPPQQVSPNVWFGRLFLHQILFLWSPPAIKPGSFHFVRWTCRLLHYSLMSCSLTHKVCTSGCFTYRCEIISFKNASSSILSILKSNLCRKITVCLQGSDQCVLNPKRTELWGDKHKTWK